MAEQVGEFEATVRQLVGAPSSVEQHLILALATGLDRAMQRLDAIECAESPALNKAIRQALNSELRPGGMLRR